MMNLLEPNMSEAGDLQERQAALLVHGLADADRQWVLESLSAEQRCRLEQLLSDLQGLGIPRDPEFVRQAIGEADDGGSQAANSETAPAQAFARLDAAAVKRLVSLMRQEPPGLVARLLAAGPWPWERELLEQLGGAHGSRVRMNEWFGSKEQPGEFLSKALVSVTLARLQSNATESAR